MHTKLDAKPVRFRNGSVLNLVLIGLLCVIVLGVGTWMYISGSGVKETDEPLTAKSFQGLFVKEVLDQGEIQSSENVEIRSKVKSRYGSRGVTVQSAIPEGTMVSGKWHTWMTIPFWEGDVLIELRSDEIKENLDKQQIAYANAIDMMRASLKNVESAEAAKNEYSEGVFIEEKTKIENEISEAQENLLKAEEYFKFSKKLQAKGFITSAVLQSDADALSRAQRTLELAKTKLKVLSSYTRVKNETQFQSDLDIAKSKLQTAENNLRIEEETLNEILEQKKACMIRVPENVSGQVVHANIFSRRGSSEFVLEEGASVREGQVLIKIPDPSKMQVKATVNESRVTSIKEGMDVLISVDALNGKQLEGVVTKVNQYAEPEGWGGGGVRKYGVLIEVSNPIPEIRPGMNASVLIETNRIEDALMVPIQAVYGYRGKEFCLVKRGNRWETVEVKVQTNNDTNVVITEGIEVGEEVALNPVAFKELLELPDLPELKDNADSKGRKRSKGRKGNDGRKGKSDSGRQDTRQKGDQGKSSKGAQRQSFQKSSGKKGDSRNSGPNSDTAKKSNKATTKKA